MTVTTIESNNTWTADGNTNEFSFTFPILDKSNLLVKKRAPSGLLANMVLGIDYTVTGIGNLPERTNYKSGKIIFLQNIPAGSKIIIKRNIPKTQEIDYVENTRLPAQGHEEALDKITMVLQELNTDSKKAVTLAPDIENITPEISNIKPDNVLKIASDGSGIIGIEIDDPDFSIGVINSIFQDNSPTLSNTLDTNGHDIRFESDHGLVNSVDNPILIFKYDNQNTSHLEIDTTKEHQQPIIRATSNNENTDLMLEAKGNGSISTLNNLNALQGISVTGSIQATDNENDDADLVLNSKGSGNTIIDGVPVVNEINNLTNIINNLEEEVTVVESNITTVDNNITNTSNKTNDLENTINTLETETNALENATNTSLNKIDTLENTITTSSNKINTLEEGINTSSSNINNLQSTTNNLSNTVNNLEYKINTSSNINSKLAWATKAFNYGFNYKLDGNNNLLLDYVSVDFYTWCKYEDFRQQTYSNNFNILDLQLVRINGIEYNHKYTGIRSTNNSTINLISNIGQYSKITKASNLSYIAFFGTLNNYYGYMVGMQYDKDNNYQYEFMEWEGRVNLCLNNNSNSYGRWPKLESIIGGMP